MEYTPKGFRDLLPQDAQLYEKITGTIKDIYRSYGFQPMLTPALEFISVLKAKSGEEIAGQIFKIEDEDVGLRFDLTVSLARVAANASFPKPFKRYFISQCWRKEEPQKGRFREFWQADADIIGSNSMRAEAELLSMTDEIMKALGFKNYRTVLNNRKLLNTLAARLNIENRTAVFRLLDKIGKMDEEKIEEEMAVLIGRKKADDLFSTLSLNGSNEEKIAAAKKIDPDGGRELEEILEFSNGNIDIDFTLVRGLDYYTGPVFEVKASNEIGSVGGGGRYDILLSLYGTGDFATGISFGIDRLLTLLKKGNPPTSSTVIFVAAVKPEFYKNTVAAAAELRKAGIAAETDLNNRNLKKQFDYANAIGAPFVAVIGANEVKEEKITLRNMKTGEEKIVSLSEAIKIVKG